MKIWPSVSLGLCLALLEGVVYAQAPPPITSSGLNTQVSAPVNLPGGKVQHNITGGTRPGGGVNLFHSFGEFGVPTNNIANFLNDAALPTSNILSRVTGGNPSNILGTIQTEGFGRANLFLMNPAGILFGPDATLNVDGATHFTTGDYLRLGDGVQFTALPGAQDALLSVAPVAAFGFLESNPASIAIEGSTLAVVEGQTLSLVGGNILIGSGLNAPEGKIAIASVGSQGEVLAETYDSVPNVNGQSFTTMGNITLLEGTNIDVSGNAAGTVIIRGGNLMMTSSTISADTGEVNGPPVAIDVTLTGSLSISSIDVPAFTAKTTGSGNAGGIHISSNQMDVTAERVNGFDDLSAIDTHTTGTGNAGPVSIETGDLTALGVSDFSTVYLINTGTDGFNVGRGGDALLTGNAIQLNNIDITTGPNLNFYDGSSTSGNVTIESERLGLNFSTILTDNALGGDFPAIGGDITITTHELNMFGSNITTTGLDGSGAMTIMSDRLSAGFSEILAQTIFAPGKDITISGRVLEFTNGSTVTSSAGGDGDAGSISITAMERINLISEFSPTGFFSNSFGILGTLGKSGDITVNTPILEMTGGSRINTTTASSGRGGNVTINSTQWISISGETINQSPDPLFSLGSIHPSGIITKTIGDTGCSGLCGDAGNVAITTGSLIMGDGAQINSGTSGTGEGGGITINAAETISIAGMLSDGSPAGLQSRTNGTLPDSGSGGNISIMTSSLNLSEGAAINSGTEGTGNGGSISVNASENISITGTLPDVTPGGVFSRTTGTAPGSGAGGAISLTTDQNFTLSDGATVSASSDGPGNAGNITMTGHDTILINKATVTTEATQASGGEIKLTANDRIQLVDSTIESTVKGDAKTVAGNIGLDPDFIILQNSHILAKAVEGQGGNITLIASKGVLVDAQSTLEVTSERGVSGTVNIESPIQVLSGTIVPLPDQPVNVATLYAARCVAGEGGHFSTFVDSKSDSVAPTPGTFLASPVLPVTDASQHAMGHDNRTPTSEVSLSGPEAAIHLTAYTPPVLFAQATSQPVPCP